MSRSRLDLLGAALLHAPFFAFVADEEMRYLAVNEYGCQALGYDESELLQLRVPDVVSLPLEPDVAYREMMQSGARSGAAVLLTKSGWEIPIRYTAGVSSTADGRPIFLSVAERTTSQGSS